MADKTRFAGAHEHAIDDKGRTVLPVKVRAQLGESAFIAALDDCLGLFTAEGWDDVVERYQARVDDAVTDDDLDLAMDALRDFTMQSAEVTLDQQGRVVIPVALREAVGIESPGPLVTYGVGDRAEIWNPERFAASRTPDSEARRSAKRRGLQRTAAERARLAEP
jgi:MraZ protein